MDDKLDQKSNSQSNGLMIYGERPITELFLALASKDDLRHLINNIQLADKNSIPFNADEEEIESIFIEAPLGRTIGYADFILVTTSFCLTFEVKPDLFIKVQKRLKKQIPGYYHSVNKSITTSRSELIKMVYKRKASKKNYLIVMTGDDECPQGLKSIYDELSSVDTSVVGWAPYRIIRSVLQNEGFEIKGISPHIWAEGRLAPFQSNLSYIREKI